MREKGKLNMVARSGRYTIRIMEALMEAKKRQVDEAVVVDIAGDVEMRSSPELRETLMELAGEKPPRVAINLAEVKFMDSSGIATLVEFLSRVRGYGGTLRLYGLNAMIRDVLTLARLDTLFEICETENEALAN